jgi:hypothetical protein
MAQTMGKVEARITVPSGGWATLVTDTVGGPIAVTVPAGTYYHSSAGSGANDLCAEFAAQLNAAALDTYTVVPSFSEGGTGKVTITAASGNTAITWTSHYFRDALGFETDDDLSGSASYTSSDQARMIWLPDSYRQQLYDDNDVGWYEGDARVAVSPGGDAYAISQNKYRVNEITWIGISKAKTRINNETTTNESFERFWRDVAYAEGPGATTAGPIRVYWDAATDATYGTYTWVGGIETNKHDQFTQNWTALYNISFPRLIEVT